MLAATKERLEAGHAADLSHLTEAELIREAGRLNNHHKLVNVDHVTFMGLMDHAEMVRHVAKLRQMAA